MSNWKETTIGNLCSIKHGYAYKGEFITNEECQDVLVTPGNFTLSGGFKIMDKPKYYKGPVIDEYILKEGDLIVTMTDLSKGIDTLGYSALVPKVDGITFHHNQRIGLIENIYKDVDKDFLYWIMRTRPYQKYVANSSSGTTVHHTSPAKISKYSFFLPTLPEQHQIASILSSFESKIECNHRLCANLEAQAQALFKHWFIDFTPFKDSKFVESKLGMIPEGWKVATLGDVLSDIESGSRPKGGAESNGIPSIGAEKIEGICHYDFSSEKFVSEEYFNNMRRGKVQNGDVLLYKDGAYTGKSTIFMNDFPYSECAVNEHVFLLRTYESKWQCWLYLYLTYEPIRRYIHTLASAKAAQPGLNQVELKSVNIILPPAEVIDRFESLAHSLLSPIIHYLKDSRILSTLRDTLLPKLMSGQIKL